MAATANRRTSALTPLETPRPEVLAEALLPAGFEAGATTAGIKASGRPDLALIRSTVGPVSAAAVFTANRLAAAPVRLSRANLGGAHGRPQGATYGLAEAMVSTSGCANAATGPAGDADQVRIAETAAGALRTAPERVLCLSTGMIGTRLPLHTILPALERLAHDGLSATDRGLRAAADALRTTDSRAKVASLELPLTATDSRGKGGIVRVAGIAKGVGMIHPRMATMLAVLLTDAALEPEPLHAILRAATDRTWNQLTVDGDTSTNDTVFLLASGAADGTHVRPGTPAFEELGRGVEAVGRSLARQQAADGEGATTLITCAVTGARSDTDARAVARAVVASSLVKAAVHGRDPNWGRVAAATGNALLSDGSPVAIEPDLLQIAIAGTLVFDGQPVPFERDAVRGAMDGDELLIRLDLGVGAGFGEAFGCDLTEQYVVENSEYST